MKGYNCARKMGDVMSLDGLLTILQQQAEMMERFGEKERELQEAILGQDWDAMERMTPILEALSHDLASIDEKRHATVVQIRSERSLPDTATFAEIVRGSDAELRKALTRAHRQLQIAVLRVKSITGGIDAYVRGNLRTANAVLGEMFPEQKGTMYSRKGVSKPAAGHAIVLDHRL